MDKISLDSATDDDAQQKQKKLEELEKKHRENKEKFRKELKKLADKYPFLGEFIVDSTKSAKEWLRLYHFLVKKKEAEKNAKNAGSNVLLPNVEPADVQQQVQNIDKLYEVLKGEQILQVCLDQVEDLSATFLEHLQAKDEHIQFQKTVPVKAVLPKPKKSKKISKHNTHLGTKTPEGKDNPKKKLSKKGFRRSFSDSRISAKEKKKAGDEKQEKKGENGTTASKDPEELVDVPLEASSSANAAAWDLEDSDGEADPLTSEEYLEELAKAQLKAEELARKKKRSKKRRFVRKLELKTMRWLQTSFKEDVPVFKQVSEDVYRVLIKHVEKMSLEWSGCTSVGEFVVALARVGTLLGKTREGTAMNLIKVILKQLQILLEQKHKTKSLQYLEDLDLEDLVKRTKARIMKESQKRKEDNKHHIKEAEKHLEEIAQEWKSDEFVHKLIPETKECIQLFTEMIPSLEEGEMIPVGEFLTALLCLFYAIEHCVEIIEYSEVNLKKLKMPGTSLARGCLKILKLPLRSGTGLPTAIKQAVKQSCAPMYKDVENANKQLKELKKTEEKLRKEQKKSNGSPLSRRSSKFGGTEDESFEERVRENERQLLIAQAELDRSVRDIHNLELITEVAIVFAVGKLDRKDGKMKEFEDSLVHFYRRLFVIAGHLNEFPDELCVKEMEMLVEEYISGARIHA